MRIIISSVIPAEARGELPDMDDETSYTLEFVNGLESMSIVFSSADEQ